jgi:preprotein translocase subunit YajC
MHIAAIATLIAATSTKPTTNSAGSIIFLVIVFALLFVMYRTFMRPRQRAAQAQRDTLITLEPGDEVLTGAGIFGTVQHVQGDRVTLWTGTGSTITVLKRTIVRKIEEDDADYEADTEHRDGEHDSWNDEDTAALEAHNSDGTSPDDDEEETAQDAGKGSSGDGVTRLGAADNGAKPVADDGAKSAADDISNSASNSSSSSAQSSVSKAPEATGDGHLADRIDELTAPDQPSEDKDR